MANGIKINLEEITTVADRYEYGNEIFDIINECHNYASAIKDYYNTGNFSSYEKQRAIVDEIDSSLRGIETNSQQIHRDLSSYVKKMSADDIVKEDAEVFVARDRSDFEDQIDKILTDIDNLKSSCKTISASHDSMMDDFKLTSGGDLEEDIKDIEDRAAIKALYAKFSLELLSISNNQSMENKVGKVKTNYKKIDGWYDKDYSTSNHIAKATVVSTKIATDVGIAYITKELHFSKIMTNATIAAVNESVKGVENWRNGATKGEAVKKSKHDFGVDLIFVLGGEHVETMTKGLFNDPLVKATIERYKPNMRIITSITNSVDEVEVGNRTKNRKNDSKSLLSNQEQQMMLEIAGGDITSETIKELNEYAENEWDIHLDEEQLRIVEGMVSVL